MQFRARVASRLARESGEPLELPCSRQTFNRIVDEVLASTGLFRLPAKSRRSAQSAPSEDLGSLVAERPGEYVAIDTTELGCVRDRPVHVPVGRAGSDRGA